MLATLRIIEGQVLASDKPQTVQALVGARETKLTLISAASIEVKGDNCLHGTGIEEGGATWEFLLHSEFKVGVAYKGNHSREEAINRLLSLIQEAECQWVAVRCG